MYGIYLLYAVNSSSKSFGSAPRGERDGGGGQFYRLLGQIRIDRYASINIYIYIYIFQKGGSRTLRQFSKGEITEIAFYYYFILMPRHCQDFSKVSCYTLEEPRPNIFRDFESLGW